MRCNLARLVSIVYRKGAVYKNNMLKELNVTAAEAPFLLTLSEVDGVSQECLSEHLSIDKASTARTIQSLINKNLVRKAKDENDKRINRIYLSEDGKKIIDQVTDIMLSWNRVITDGMTEDEIERQYEVFKLMVANIENHFNKMCEKCNEKNKEEIINE